MDLWYRFPFVAFSGLLSQLSKVPGLPSHPRLTAKPLKAFVEYLKSKPQWRQISLTSWMLLVQVPAWPCIKAAFIRNPGALWYSASRSIHQVTCFDAGSMLPGRAGYPQPHGSWDEYAYRLFG